LTVAGVVGVGGLELELRHHPREAERSELERRADVNGSIIALGTAQRYVVVIYSYVTAPAILTSAQHFCSPCSLWRAACRVSSPTRHWVRRPPPGHNVVWGQLSVHLGHQPILCRQDVLVHL
jgi:hypothetical protein